MTIEDLARKWEMSDPPEDRHLPTRAQDDARWWARAFAEVLANQAKVEPNEITSFGLHRASDLLRGLADD